MKRWEALCCQAAFPWPIRWELRETLKENAERVCVCAIPGRLILNSYQSDNTTECKRGENRRKRSTVVSGGGQKWRKVSNAYGSEYTSSSPLV